MEKDLGTGDIGTPPCLETKKTIGKTHIDALVRARIVLDWKSNKYTRKQLSEIYGYSESSIFEYTKDVEKGELTEEVLDILESRNREKMLQALKNESLTEEYIAGKIKELCENKDPRYIKAGIQEFNRIKGNYKEIGAKKIDNSKTMNLIKLPERKDNTRDEKEVEDRDV